MRVCRLRYLSKISSFIFITVVVTFAASQLITNTGSVYSNLPSGSGGGGNVNGESAGNNDQFVMEISPNCSYNPTAFKIMGDSIERALTFLEQNVEKLVLDAAVGTRVVEAQIKLTLETHPRLPELMKTYLKYLMNKSRFLSERIIKAVEDNPNISDVEKQHTLPWVKISNLWDWPLDNRWESNSVMKSYEPHDGINTSSILSKSQETIEEDQSDACIFQVFNCDSQEISDTCRKLFFDQEQSLYSLTHQVIYTLFAAKRQCFKGVNSKDSQGLRNFQQNLCGKVWLEANAIGQSDFPPQYRDLFVEQIGICGMTGYPNFLREDWLQELLSWQSKKKSGCFLDQRVPASTISMLLQLYQENQLKFQEYVNQRFKVASRQKRSDAFLRQGINENCSVHFTAVGLTAISLHLRYFVDNCFSSY